MRFMIALMAALIAAPALAADIPAQWKSAWPKTDFSRIAVDPAEIFSGGPPKDGIPAIDNPTLIPASTETTLDPREPVMSVQAEGMPARAYPIRYLMWHEIVNDRIRDVPIAVTFCPLCNSAIVFERRVDGEETTFGTTGMLRNSDLVMYDRKTETWWQQFTGEAIIGERTGDILKMIPVRVVSFENFKAEVPEGKVVQPAALRQYGMNPYAGYDSRSRPYPFFTGKMPEGINPMARVIVIRDGKKVTAVSLAMVRDKTSIDVDGVTVTWTKGVNSALDSQAIAEGRDVGAVRVQKDGKDMVHDITFAFAFHAFHPDIAILN